MSADPVDMSPAAVARRLQILASLYRLARSLSSARIIGPVETSDVREVDRARRDGGT
jgi:hypothetical protein